MLTNEFLLEFIIENSAKFGITGYDIAKNTSLSDQSAYKILNGVTKNPRRKNLLEILDYLENKVVGIALPGHPNYNKEIADRLNEVSEPETHYKKLDEINKTDITVMQTKIADLAVQNMELTQQNYKLKALLQKHNIDFSHIVVE